MGHLLHENLGAAGPLLLTVACGMTIGYSAVLLPQIEPQTNGTITATVDQASWIASLAALPQSVAALLGGYLIEKFGRKTTHVITSLPNFAGWIVIYTAYNVEMLMAGRFITGFCAGVLAPATGVYIGETAEPKYRGFLLGGISLSISGGLLVCHVLGTFLHWQTTALICSLVPLLACVIMLLAPESPAWLAKKGKTEKAEKSFRWFRGESDEAEKELAVMLTRQNQTDDPHSPKDLASKFKVLLRPECLKPLGIVIVFFILSQWAGPNAINYYSVTIMKQTLGDGVDEYLATIIIDVIRVIVSVVGCVVMRKYKRRPLAMVSGFGTFLSLFLLSGFTYGSKVDLEHSQILSYVSVAAVVAYIVFITVGFVAMQWSLVGELLPLTGRSTASGVASFVAFFTTFTVVKVTPAMFNSLKPEGTFLLFGVMALLSTVFNYFCLPETKGKTLDEIEDYFKGKKETELKEFPVKT
ncbi:facilitated trehalose transporter Tret1-2 homolog isoform X2 [Cylas formicarius]|uniref:facilitated trehalose transporter Tret1-2 homolog isoform X2 n=1 Tax=Cylas formicarius TaxID=197179 RepID=UPI002958D1BE|nr:facilitated trehalose transporter Tret1-2 homolog isoform X2 [Cylas formicarius]